MTPAVSSFPDVTRPELKVRGRPFFVLTLHVRKTGKCHREAWMAGWQFPNVTRQEQNLRGRPISFLMLHVGKTGRGKQGEKCHTDHPERPQRGWNSVVPNRFGIDVPWRAVWRGWTGLAGPSTRGKSQNDFEQLPSSPGAGSCPPKPSASLHPVACHCVHSGS